VEVKPMRKLLSQLSISIICFLLGFMLTHQIKHNILHDAQVVAKSNVNSADILQEIEALRELRSELRHRNAEAAARIKTYEAEASQENYHLKLMKDKLDRSRVLLGMTEVQGEGIVIYITSKSNVFTDYTTLLSDVELIYVINELYYAGAEAIAINDLRITFQSNIRMANTNNFVIINDERIPTSNRITIKAIGNKSRLADAINVTFDSSFEAFKYYDIKAESHNEINISKFNKNYDFNDIYISK
jgi:uncharacterized protein YlxW (UPF0749 family)